MTTLRLFRDKGATFCALLCAYSPLCLSVPLSFLSAYTCASVFTLCVHRVACRAERPPSVGSGSGVVWANDAKDGLIIVTNSHVVGAGAAGARGAAVAKGTIISLAISGCEDKPTAEVVGLDADKDLAVLRVKPPLSKNIQAAKLRPVELARSAALKVGQVCYALGSPFGLEHTLSRGIVSGLDREIPSGVNRRPITGIIQTDAAVNPGNSGGPLLDRHGRLIGLATAIASPSGTFAGVGFAVPADIVSSAVEQLLKFGRVLRPALGVSLLPDTLVRQIGLEGALVLRVSPGSPAEACGLRPTEEVTSVSEADDLGWGGVRRAVRLGDMIVGVAGKRIRSSTDLLRALDGRADGERVEMLVVDAGAAAEAVVKAGGLGVPRVLRGKPRKVVATMAVLGLD